MRVCSEPGCGILVSKSGRCPEHRRATDAARGRRQARGYDAAHDSHRAQVAILVRRGTAICWRCGQLIDPDEPWDLGHDDHDRTKYRGPEHIGCNRSTSGRCVLPPEEG